MSTDELAAWVAESRVAQQLPAHVENDDVLARLAALLAETVPAKGGGGRAPA